MENIDGIKYVEKEPFMVDVHPTINPDLVTQNLQGWINKYDLSDSTYNGNILIPNVKYILLDKQEFKSAYKDSNYKEFKGKAIIHNPISLIENDEKDSNLSGEEINLIRRFQEDGNLETKEWRVDIFESFNHPFYLKVDASLTIAEADYFIIVLDEETAIDNNLFPGYKDLTIYLEDNLSLEKIEEIESTLYRMTVTIPSFEIVAYLLIATTLSFGIYLIALFIINHIHPTYKYI